MKKIFAASAFVFISAAGGLLAGAQVVDDSGVSGQFDTLRSISEKAHDDDRRFRPPGKRARMSFLSSENRARLITRLESLALGGHRELMLPPAKYFSQYADLLRDGKTGLARVFPDRKCDRGIIVDISELERCAAYPLRGAGSRYSFRNRTSLTRNAWADINFIDDKFVAGGQTEFGLISEIGEVELGSLSLISKELAFLTGYRPKNKASEIRREKEIFVKGLTENGLIYTLSAPAKLNSTYVLRSVAYELESFDGIDRRADIIVAFKVISREPDGSLILLWKELRSTAAGRLKADR